MLSGSLATCLQHFMKLSSESWSWMKLSGNVSLSQPSNFSSFNRSSPMPSESGKMRIKKTWCRITVDGCWIPSGSDSMSQPSLSSPGCGLALRLSFVSVGIWLRMVKVPSFLANAWQHPKLRSSRDARLPNPSKSGRVGSDLE